MRSFECHLKMYWIAAFFFLGNFIQNLSSKLFKRLETKEKEKAFSNEFTFFECKSIENKKHFVCKRQLSRFTSTTTEIERARERENGEEKKARHNSK